MAFPLYLDVPFDTSMLGYSEVSIKHTKGWDFPYVFLSNLAFKAILLFVYYIYEFWRFGLG